MPEGFGYGGGKFSGKYGAASSGGQRQAHGVPVPMPQPLVTAGSPDAAKLSGQQVRKGAVMDAAGRPSIGPGYTR